MKLSLRNPPTLLYCCMFPYEGPAAIFSTLEKAKEYAAKEPGIHDIEVWRLDDPDSSFDREVLSVRH